MKNNYTSGGNGGGASYGRDNRNSGGGRSWGGDNRGGRSGGRDSGSRGPVTMYPAVCAECKSQTEVPFLPNGRKPVLCKDCFSAQGGGQGGDRGNDRGNSQGKPAYSSRPTTSSFPASNQKIEKQLEGIYTKLDQILNALLNNPEVKEKTTKAIVDAIAETTEVVERKGYPKVKVKVKSKSKAKAKVGTRAKIKTTKTSAKKAVTKKKK